MIFKGPFRIAAEDTRDFSFTILFPECAQIPEREGTEHPIDGDDRGRLSQQISNGRWERMPPSFETSFHDAEEFGIFSVQYYVETIVDMPGIDVKPVPDAPVLISYTMPRSRPQAVRVVNTMFEHKLSISNRDLIAESERARGFKRKTRAFFREANPRYDFDVLCKDVPTHICLRQPFMFTVTIRTNDEHTTCSVQPEITLHECKVTINALTTLFSSQPGQQRPQKTIAEKVLLLTGAARPEGPFSSRDNYTKSISTGPLQEDNIVPSFAVDNLSRSYKARIDMQFRAAKQKLDVKRDFPLTIHPALQQSVEVEEEVGLGVARSHNSQADEEQLPAYEEPTPEPPAMEENRAVREV